MEQGLDLRLRELRNRMASTDPLLLRVIRHSVEDSARIFFGVNLLLGTTQVRGVIASDSAMAGELDQEMKWFFRVMQALERVDGGNGSNWDALIEMTGEGFIRAGAEADREAKMAFEEAMDEAELWPADVTRLPEELAEDGLRFLTPRTAFTLEQAQMKVPGEAWEDVGLMRVAIAQISAWWPLHVEAPDKAAEFLGADE